MTLGPSPVFLYYEKKKPMAKMEQIQWREAYLTKMMDMSTFFSALEQLEKRNQNQDQVQQKDSFVEQPFFYFSQTLNKFPELMKVMNDDRFITYF